MIFPRRGRLAEAIFSIYLKRLYRSHFSAFRILEEYPAEARDGDPVLLLPNHSSWWDGFVLFLHNRLELKKNFSLMMLERELQKNKFFSRLGAFSIDPSHPRKILESLHFCVDVLKSGDSHTGLILFPQGEILPNVSKHYRFRPGVSWILARLPRPVHVVSVQIRLLFTGNQYPEIALGYRFLGKSRAMMKPDEADWFQESFSRAQEAFDEKLNSGAPGRLLLAGKKSIHESLSLP